MFTEVKNFGYYEITASYTDWQLHALAAVYSSAKKQTVRKKAEFMLDELFLQLAHLYQPGSAPGQSYKSSYYPRYSENIFEQSCIVLSRKSAF